MWGTQWRLSATRYLPSEDENPYPCKEYELCADDGDFTPRYRKIPWTLL
jgi:hypothetical protein